MNELTNVNVTFKLPEIKYDLTEVKKQTKEIIEKYQDLVISEDDILTMKDDIANLNKLSKAIDKERKSVVKQIKAPLTGFETELKAIVTDLNTAYRNVKDQIDTYADKQKELRREEIMAWEEFESYMIVDEKMLAKSKSDNAVKIELEHQKSVYETNEKLISTTCSMVQLEKEKYIELLNHNRDINEIIAFIENDKKVKESYSKPVEEVKPVARPIIKEEKHQEVYIITATNTQLNGLEKYLLENDIEYQVQEGDLF